ncbi:MAG: FAD-binding protein [Oscillospiraceae bacterium]|nr:FAD-binding protein [Oscillospiraceae bacterium]
MHIYDALIIGTGAAGYAAADALHRFGVTDIAILTNGRERGTSRNTGSDKQTYYKPSLDGQTPDCAAALAEDFMRGGCCDGVLAYTEAANALRCFYRLLELGVPFPQDPWGCFPSYVTDHDRGGRATSVGPLTSKRMVESLEDQVLYKNKTPLLDRMQVIKILLRDGRAAGVLALNGNDEAVRVLARSVVFATGAPARIYAQSVYPQSQRGATGVMLAAGVRLVNFCEWQYGLASVGFRWNLSGSYLQAMPRVYSKDANGRERDFLWGALGDSAAAMLFCKGAQWPFDARKIDGTSKIDLLVRDETAAGRQVYLDYRQNPKGYSFGALPKDVRGYLTERGAAAETPIARLGRLNPAAIELYRGHNIDLAREPLEAAVCAQHNNGGVLVDEHGQSGVPGLYAVGEAAGVFGLTRPGGSALNSTQVGGLRAAAHIAVREKTEIPAHTGEDELRALEKQIAAIMVDQSTPESAVPAEMSRCAGFLREREGMAALLEQIESRLRSPDRRARSVSEYFYESDMLESARAMLVSALGTMERTGSRGGALYTEGGAAFPENTEYRDFRAVTSGGGVTFIPVRPVPRERMVFESLL